MSTKGGAGCCAGLGELLNPRFFKALCDSSRLGILALIAGCGKPQTVSQIASVCTVDLSVVSRHLAILRDADILEANRQGKEVFYRLKAREVVTMLRELADAIEACCAQDAPPGEPPGDGTVKGETK